MKYIWFNENSLHCSDFLHNTHFPDGWKRHSSDWSEDGSWEPPMDMMILYLLKGILGKTEYLCHISRENVHIKFPITYGFLLGTQECSSPLQPHSLCLGNTHPVSWALHLMGIRKYSIPARMLYVVIREMAIWLPPMNVSTVTLISVNLPWFGEIYINQTDAFTLKCQRSYNKYLLSREPSMQHRPAWPWTNKPLIYLWNENVSSIYFLGLVCDTG